MKLARPTTAAALAQRLGARLLGEGELVVFGLNEIHHVEAGDLTFVDFHKYYKVALSSAASVVLIDQEHPCPPGKALLVVDQPFTVYNELVTEERPVVDIRDAVAKNATVHPTARVSAGAVVAPGAVVGPDCLIGPNAVIGEGVELGARVVVGAGAVIGGEAFYYKKTAEGYRPWRSGGSVRLEDDVEIGPNCTVARGVSSVTVIGQGTKLDALVQIGHDCKIGRHCLFAAQVGVAGNTTIGDWCLFQGQVGIAQNLTIGNHCVVLAKSGIGMDLEDGKRYFGIPAQEARTAFRDLALVRRLRHE